MDPALEPTAMSTKLTSSTTGGAPTFEEMVREKASITLGDAKRYAAALAPEKRRCACGCYACRSPSCPTCCCLGPPSCLLNLGCCLMYNPFLCACPDGDTPGAWTCTDMKGIMYFLVPVDEKGTLAWFSEHALQGQGDALKVNCYCTKLC